MPYQKKKFHLIYPEEFKLPDKITMDREKLQVELFLEACKFTGAVYTPGWVRTDDLIKEKNGKFKRNYIKFEFKNGILLKTSSVRYSKAYQIRLERNETDLPE